MIYAWGAKVHGLCCVCLSLWVGQLVVTGIQEGVRLERRCECWWDDGLPGHSRRMGECLCWWWVTVWYVAAAGRHDEGIAGRQALFDGDALDKSIHERHLVQVKGRMPALCGRAVCALAG